MKLKEKQVVLIETTTHVIFLLMNDTIKLIK